MFNFFENLFSPKPNKKLKSIDNFQIERFLGRWYELVRYDHYFEKFQTNVYAEYSINKNGSIKIKNYGKLNNKIILVIGTGKFNDESHKNIGCFKISYFWPFYGEYKILYIDMEYKYAIISSSNEKYFWIMSRLNEIEEETMTFLLNKAKEFGFEKSKMIFN